MHRSLLGLLCLMAFASYAQIYKTIDHEGHETFTDREIPGAVRVDLPQEQLYSAPKTKVKSLSAVKTKTTSSPIIREKYQQFAILTPANEATIRNGTGTVNVVVQLSPALRQGSSIRLFLDDVPMGDFQTLSIDLNNVNRGTHHLHALVVNNHGKILNQTKKVTFFMHRPRVNMNPNNQSKSQGINH